MVCTCNFYFHEYKKKKKKKKKKRGGRRIKTSELNLMLLAKERYFFCACIFNGMYSKTFENVKACGCFFFVKERNLKLF